MPRRDPARPIWLYGHRGASAELPENTLEAFARAVEVGADAVETDVRLTRDGVPVLHHDATGERMAGVRERVERTDLADLRRWDAGARFRAPDGSTPHAGRGFRVPTLEETVRELPDTPLNIDLKHPSPELARRVVALIHRLGAAERVRLTSFRARTVWQAARLGYAGPLGLGLGDVLRALATPRLLSRWLSPRGTALQVAPRHGPLRFESPAMIRRAHAAGLRVDFWTINDPDEAGRLLRAGADGVMSDDPASIAPIVSQWRQSGGVKG